MHKHLTTILSTTISTYLTVGCSTSAQTLENNRTGGQNAASNVNDNRSNLKSSNGQATGNGATAGDRKNSASGSDVSVGTEASTPFLIAGSNQPDKAPPFPQPGDGMSDIASTPFPVSGTNLPSTTSGDGTTSVPGASQAQTPLLVGGSFGDTRSTMPIVGSNTQGQATSPQPTAVSPMPVPGVSALTDATLIDAVLECSKLLQVTSFSLKSTCQVFSNTGVALELKTAANTWKWSTINTNSCTPLKAERAMTGTPTTYDLTFVGSSVTPCMMNTVVQIDISPKSGGTLMLQASPT